MADLYKFLASYEVLIYILLAIGGVIPTTVVTGYRQEDLNLDGDVKYTNINNDRDLILQSIGGVIPTTIRYEQLP